MIVRAEEEVLHSNLRALFTAMKSKKFADRALYSHKRRNFFDFFIHNVFFHVDNFMHLVDI